MHRTDASDATGRAALLVGELRGLGSPANAAGMARYGINPRAALGVPMPTVRSIAKRHRRDQALSLALWDTGVHEARILASIVGDPKQVTEAQMDAWVAALDSWDVCDQCCSNLFARTPFAYAKAHQWAAREQTFVKRAGFVLMAQLAVHDKKAPDARFLEMLPVIEAAADDDRNFVRKGVNWALRQIGKRSASLHAAAVGSAERIAARGSRSARWIASDALRELRTKGPPTPKVKR